MASLLFLMSRVGILVMQQIQNNGDLFFIQFHFTFFYSGQNEIYDLL